MPPGSTALASLTPLLVFALQFVALQALLGLGCGRLDTSSLRWVAAASGLVGAALLLRLAWRNRHAKPAAGAALAGVGLSTAAALWLAPCAVLG